MKFNSTKVVEINIDKSGSVVKTDKTASSKAFPEIVKIDPKKAEEAQARMKAEAEAKANAQNSSIGQVVTEPASELNEPAVSSTNNVDQKNETQASDNVNIFLTENPVISPILDLYLRALSEFSYDPDPGADFF